MDRKKMISKLEKYHPFDAKESKMHQQVLEFARRVPDCFDDYYPEGHIVAGAWVLDKKQRKIGLVHHKKVHKWLQPGGHSDGSSDTPQEALREATEELGIDNLRLANENIFDIDVHTIYEDKKRNLAKHFHFELRFLVLGDSSISPVCSSESDEVKWVDLDKVLDYNNEEAMQRFVKKTYKLPHK